MINDAKTGCIRIRKNWLTNMEDTKLGECKEMERGRKRERKKKDERIVGIACEEE